MARVFPHRLRSLGCAVGLATVLLGAGGCYVPATRSCATCVPLRIGQRPAIPLGTRQVFLLVPGMLGYGWEWDGAQAALRALPDTAVLVYDWDPWQSLEASSARLGSHLHYLLRRLPRSVGEVTVIGHSLAGLLVTEAAGSIEVPAGLRVRVWAVGAPLAGSGTNPYSSSDMRATPLPIALGGIFTHWPRPAPGVRLEIFPTGPDDPVMMRRLFHDPGDVRALPPGSIYRPLPSQVGHNSALTYLCSQLVQAPVAAGPALVSSDGGAVPARPQPAPKPLPPRPGPRLPALRL